jgi:hypothetical protein
LIEAEPMGKNRESWERIYDGIRVVRDPATVHFSLTDAELDEVESQLDARLPLTYREFMKRLGSGEIQGWVRLCPPWSIVVQTTWHRKCFSESADRLVNHAWLASLIYFGSDFCGNLYAWDPADHTRSGSWEYRSYQLPRMDEDHPVAVSDSFWKFVTWVRADVLSWGDDEMLEHHGGGLEFQPSPVRRKKRPRKADVKKWLAWNHGTVLNLAKSLREQPQPGGFFILADALEEVGCTHADLLDSCRRGVPDIDGSWVLEMLLGKS